MFTPPLAFTPPNQPFPTRIRWLEMWREDSTEEDNEKSIEIEDKKEYNKEEDNIEKTFKN